MLAKLNALFDRAFGGDHPPPAEEREHALRVATALLLIEVARADYAHAPIERAALREGLARELHVPEAVLDALLSKAEQRAQQSVSLFEFVQTLNRTMAQEQKQGLLNLLWQVAHADGRVDPQEEHLLRRIADLLHLSHADFIRGKLAAAGKSGPGA